MYGLPKDFDSNIFIGINLVQVCFTINNVTFHFDDDLHVTTETEFVFTLNGKRHSSVPENVSIECLSLLETPVTSALVVDQGTLELRFGESMALIFLDTSENYESYSITNSGVTTIV